MKLEQETTAEPLTNDERFSEEVGLIAPQLLDRRIAGKAVLHVAG